MSGISGTGAYPTSGVGGSEEKYPTTIKQLEVMRKIAEEYYKEHPAEKEKERRTERLLRKGKPNRFSVGRDIVLPIAKFTASVVVVIMVISLALRVFSRYSGASDS